MFESKNKMQQANKGDSHALCVGSHTVFHCMSSYYHPASHLPLPPPAAGLITAWCLIKEQFAFIFQAVLLTVQTNTCPFHHGETAAFKHRVLHKTQAACGRQQYK